MPEFPADILRAMEAGEQLSDDQFRRLIAIEAHAIGMSFDDAVRAARERTLPESPIGADLGLLIGMLQVA